MEFEITWTKIAQNQFKAAFDYISLTSEDNAINVSNVILNVLEQTKQNPEMFPLDKFKLFNDGTYRAFEKHHYRLTYRFKNNKIKVLRIRHTSRNPKWI